MLKIGDSSITNFILPCTLNDHVLSYSGLDSYEISQRVQKKLKGMSVLIMTLKYVFIWFGKNSHWSLPSDVIASHIHDVVSSLKKFGFKGKTLIGELKSKDKKIQTTFTKINDKLYEYFKNDDKVFILSFKLTDDHFTDNLHITEDAYKIVQDEILDACYFR